jgi:branched-chain amino acid transport system substrate-binding protein
MSLHGDIVIGLSLPKTGRYATKAGIVYERAYNLWLKEINERGGLLGRRARFLIYDDGSAPEQAAENYHRLIHDDKVPLMLGPCHSALVEAAAPIVENARRLLLQGSGSSHEIFEKNRKYLFLCWSGCDFDYPKSFLELMAGTRRAERSRTAALAYTDGRIGHAVALGVKHYTALYGFELAHEEVITKPPFDYSGMMRRIKSKRPDAVLIGLDHTRPDEPMHSCVVEAQKAELKPTTIWLSDNPSVEDAHLGSAIDGIFMRATWVSIDPDALSKNFTESFRAEYGIEPEYHAAGGYACCQVLEQAVEATGNLDNEALKETLLHRVFRTAMGKLRFGTDGLPSGTIKVCQWQSGKLEIVYPELGRTAPPRLDFDAVKL